MTEKEELKKEEPEKGKDEKKEPEPKVSYFDLYKFATGYDWFLIIMGWLASLVVGVSEPVIMIIFGKGMDEFITPARFAYCDANLTIYSEKICAITMRFMTDEERATLNESQYDSDMVMDSMIGNIYWFIGIAGVTWLCGWIQCYCLMWSAQRQVGKLRSAFFRAIVRQDIGFFDVTDTGKLNTRMVDDMKKIEDAIAEKMGIAINSIAGFIGGLTIAFIYGWKMTLVLFGALPPMALAGYLWFSVDSKYSKVVLDSYAAAGAIAEEVLAGVRTVTAFNAQTEEVERYALPLKDAQAAGTRKSAMTGLVIGFFYLVMFCMEGLAFWYGAQLIIEDHYTVAQKIIVFSGSIMGAFCLSQLGTSMESIMGGQTAAHPIFEVLNRVPKIDTQSPDGVKLNPDSVNGNVQFKDVHFTYPARQEQKILKNVSFSVEAGKTTALVGQSGCGKSTAFHLMKRFYDPDEGVVTLDGQDLKDINVKSLRSVIGVVSQEPVLFESTVIENIKMGALDVSEEEIHRACRQANCYDFIQKLPDKWDTFVGEGGATLSGGQKQRIAIARALVRNPKILLLDEATSALDTESESIVQKALDNASKGRTTIVIAHRLSTIKNADKIICFRDGEVTEEGNHDSLLLNENGVYYNLCNMQTFDSAPTDTGRELEAKKSSLTKFSRHSIKSAKDEAPEKAAKEDLPDVGYMRILKANAPEWYLMAIGALFSMATGALQPIWALFFADIFQLYGSYNCAYNDQIANYNETTFDAINFETLQNDTFDFADVRAQKVGENAPCNLEELQEKIVHFSWMFCLLGALNFVGFLGSTALFGISGEKLTTRLRKKCFKKLLSLEIGYFDDALNSTGALTTRLASEASKVQGATGAQINAGLKTTGAFICGFSIGFYYSWELTLACFGFTPPLVVCSALMMNIFTGKGGEEEVKSMEECGRIATETTLNIQTVASLGREDTFAQKYDETTQNRLAKKGGKINYYGFLYGAGRGLVFALYAAIFWFTAYLLQIGRLSGDTVMADMMKVLFGIMFAALTAGDASSMAPDYGEALTAAKRIFALLDRESSIDPLNDGGVSPDSCKGEVTFESVEFSYPSRPDVKVLKGLSLTVKPGETLALVGQSGCGKSTCIQLIERFYDGSAGNVSLDGHRLQELNVKWLRRQIGFVQQEPILFDKTIKENITYGGETTPGGGKASKSNRVGVEKEAISDSVIENAAKEANALDFIQSLPGQFDTMCGKKGGQLSGGQKQRVAIARALVRQPKILLLDEATSALDAESEKLVQTALNAAQEGRTCILIAHRLSTVINADKIAVIDNGSVVEIGTHQSLLEKRGAYYSLVNSQLS